LTLFSWEERWLQCLSFGGARVLNAEADRFFFIIFFFFFFFFFKFLVPDIASWRRGWAAPNDLLQMPVQKVGFLIWWIFHHKAILNQNVKLLYPWSSFSLWTDMRGIWWAGFSAFLFFLSSSQLYSLFLPWKFLGKVQSREDKANQDYLERFFLFFGFSKRVQTFKLQLLLPKTEKPSLVRSARIILKKMMDAITWVPFPSSIPCLPFSLLLFSLSSACRKPAGCGYKIFLSKNEKKKNKKIKKLVDRHEFCWLCLAPYGDIRKHGNHYHKPTCHHYFPFDE